MMFRWRNTLLFLVLFGSANACDSSSDGFGVRLRAVDLWRLELRWSISRCAGHARQMFDVQVGRAERMDVVHTMSVSAGASNATSVIWASQLPLKCADHSVRIRRVVDNSTRGSWSAWKTNYGDKNLSQNKVMMFPDGQVLKEGSTLLFCCVFYNNVHVTSLFFNNTAYKAIDISPHVKAIRVERLNATNAFGVNFFCNKDKQGGILNFVTFPPEKPQHVRCESRDLRNISCWWKVRRAPNLGGSRRRKYRLLIRDSEDVACSLEAERLVFCRFQVIKQQVTYNITLLVKNSLGQASENYAFSITDRVFPFPERCDVTAGTHEATITLQLDGDFKDLSIICQIEVEPGGTVQEVHQNGSDSVQHYTFRIQQLWPSKNYTTRGRCAVQGNDWGQWTQSRLFVTEALVRVDLWRQIRDHPNRSVTLLWNTVSTDSALFVEVYEVCKSHRDLHRSVCVNVTQPHADLTVGVHACDIAVRAVTQKGLSMPSQITIPSAYTAGGMLKERRIMGNAEGFLLTWMRDSAATCDYTVEWCMLGAAAILQWRKVPVNQTVLFLKAKDFKPGVRYAFTVFGCSTEGHRPHEKQIGYLKELKPVQYPILDPNPAVSCSSVTLSWSFNEEDWSHTGFISRYEITLQEDSDADVTLRHHRQSVNNPQQKSFTFTDLEEDYSYQFHLAACSSAGCGPETSVTIRTRKNYYLLSVRILAPLLVLAGCCVCLCSFRKTLGEIPEEFRFLHIKALDLDKDLYEASEKIGAVRIEDCSWCEVEVGDIQKTRLRSSEDLTLSFMGPEITKPAYLTSPYQLSAGVWEEPSISLTNFTYVSDERVLTDEEEQEHNNLSFTSDYISSIAVPVGPCISTGRTT